MNILIIKLGATGDVVRTTPLLRHFKGSVTWLTTAKNSLLLHDEHIKTDHLLPDLKRHTISGGAITMSAQAAKFVLNLAATVILARLLAPRDFGLVAMVTAVTGFVAIFRHAGLATPTVQRENLTHAQVSNLFWINLALSAFCALVVAVLSPLIARFYHVWF